MILIFLILNTIPMYTMSTLRVPSQICKDLDSILRRFWWKGDIGCNRFLAIKAWKDICLPRGLVVSGLDALIKLMKPSWPNLLGRWSSRTKGFLLKLCYQNIIPLFLSCISPYRQCIHKFGKIFPWSRTWLEEGWDGWLAREPKFAYSKILGLLILMAAVLFYAPSDVLQLFPLCVLYCNFCGIN